MAIERIGVKADREFGEFLTTVLEHHAITVGDRFFTKRQDENPCGWTEQLTYHPVTREQFVAACFGAWWPEDPEPEHPTYIRTSQRGSNGITYLANEIQVGCAIVSREEIESILNYMNYLRGKKNE